MAHRVVLEASAGRAAATAVEMYRFGLGWTAERCFDLQPLQEHGPRPGAGELATGEHVQHALEAAGYRLDASSFDALFKLDDQVRQDEAALFLVRDPGTGRVGVCTTAGDVLDPSVLQDRLARLSLSTAGRLLESAAPIGYRTLTSPALAAYSRVDEVALFARAVERVWSRQGVLNVRDVQDWAMARADGDGRRVSKVEARLSVGATGFWSSVRLTVAISVLRDRPPNAATVNEADPRPTMRRSAPASAALSTAWHLSQ